VFIMVIDLLPKGKNPGSGNKKFIKIKIIIYLAYY
jgi:hypothetical protein